MSKKNQFYSRKARKKGNKGDIKVVRTINGIEIHDKIVNDLNLSTEWAKKHLVVITE